MGVGRHHIVCRIDVEPAGAWKEDRDPGVGRLSPLHLRTASDVSADITCRETMRTKNSNHYVSKVLAHAATVFQDFDQREIDGSGVRLVLEVFVNAVRQF